LKGKQIKLPLQFNQYQPTKSFFPLHPIRAFQFGAIVTLNNVQKLAKNARSSI